MRRLYRIGAIVGAILLPIGAGLATGTTEASAATYQVYCSIPNGTTFACLNAWAGGPDVKVEESDSSAIQNNHFQVLAEGNDTYQIQFVGGGAYNNDCIGDEGDTSGNAAAGLVPCNTMQSGPGWGTIFEETSSTCGALIAFHNRHWNGYLGPIDGYVTGSRFYLNKPSPVCFGTG
jgi:hypothetical protein